ncbi:hypothetical protein KIN20_011965 [Parelaphostrongylus tenuis]|uniref:Uncharacterized protein n=1 Tax=Parelaphostrongylus tenuis TaxID=148309 RepID=A0AAD5QLE3_PARTN|nr:hypothetical protein KIN20_011965 [Parelaphostrongylus tenuis]
MAHSLVLSHKNEALIKASEQLEKALVKVKQDQIQIQNSITLEDLTAARVQCQAGLSVVEKMTDNVQKGLDISLDKLREIHPDPDNAEQNYRDTLTYSQQLLDDSFEYTTILLTQIDSLRQQAEHSQTSQLPTKKVETTETPIVRKMELPTIPIPTFNGDIWEWDNFWELYNVNVHSQNISDLQKFNYLINSLKGEPLQAIESSKSAVITIKRPSMLSPPNTQTQKRSSPNCFKSKTELRFAQTL